MKYWSNLLAFMLMVSMGACSSENIVSEELGLNIEAEITEISAVIDELQYEDATSRTTVTMGDFNNNTIELVWAEKDTIGIYPTEGDQLSFPIVEGVGTTTCVFNGGGWALKTSSSYKAYTPFNRSYYYKKTDNLPVSMLGQKQVGNGNSSHLGRYDLQIANGDTPASGKITFGFKRQVCFVRLDLTAPVATTWKSITLESNAAFTTKASLDLSSSIFVLTPTATSNSVSLDLENVTTKSGEVITAYMAILPIDLTGKTLDVVLKDSDDNLYKETAVIAHDYRNFKANYSRWITATAFEEYIPYVTFKADAQQTFRMSEAVETLEYSLNGGEWKELGTNRVSFGGESGDLRLRGKNVLGTHGVNVSFGNVEPVACIGDIRTLLDYENYTIVDTSNASFKSLFFGCSNLITAPSLPATTLAVACYHSMFYGCSSLTAAPSLPSTTLANGCYGYMFCNCSSLTTAPSLPATVLTNLCYQFMFSGCSSLTTAPSLPATTLADNCYNSMFSGCSSLTTAPSLPATTLADNCYNSMFSGCSSLTTAPSLPAITLTSSCYSAMFSNCSSLTVAPILPATTLADNCYHWMFHGCSNLTIAPTLPATTLADNCYNSMFSYCRSLTATPTLPATTLADNCYKSMFSGCRSLKNITMLATDISAQFCLQDWVNGVSSTGTFTKAASMASLPSGSSGIPSLWTVVNYIGE